MQQSSELLLRLQAERERLRSEVFEVASRPAEYRRTGESFYGNHIADSASDTFEDEKTLALGAHLNGMISKVEDALSRFESGTYGICGRCGQPIAAERLEALPYAASCVGCSAPSRRRRTAGNV